MAQRSPIRSFLSIVPSGRKREPSGRKRSPNKKTASDRHSVARGRSPRRVLKRQQGQGSPAEERLPRRLGRRRVSDSLDLSVPPQARDLGDRSPGKLEQIASISGRNSRNRSLSRENGRIRPGNNNGLQAAESATVSRPNAPGPTQPRPRNQRKNRRATKRRLRPISPLLYAARMLIFGIGLSALAGTLFSVWDPARQPGLSSVEKSRGQSQEQQTSKRQPFRLGVPTVLQLGQEITDLKAEFQSLTAKSSDLAPGVFLVDMDNGAYVDWNGTLAFSAASTIKLPILIAFFQDVDAGKIRLDEKLTIQSQHIAGGSGNMQYQPAGTEYAALDVAAKMIAISDNTATNMLIERLGGEADLNHRFKSWGLTVTQISNPLPDLEGTNTSSPRDLVHLMAMMNQGELLSLRSRDRAFDILQATKNNTLLPQGLEAGASIAHKTGDIGTAIADAGIVDMPNGKRYLIAAIVKRPHNDPDAEELIRQISSSAYEFLKDSDRGTDKSAKI